MAIEMSALSDTGTGSELEESAPAQIEGWVLAWLLERAIARNEHSMQHSALNPNHCHDLHRQPLTVFDGTHRPSISVANYLERIVKYANCSPSCFIVAFIYLNRFTHYHPLIPITSLNVHRLLITSVMLATKFLDDRYYNNAYYARVGGIGSVDEVNRMEVEFLFRLGFRLHVPTQLFDKYYTQLRKESSLYIAIHHIQRTSILNYPSHKEDEEQMLNYTLLCNRLYC